jgi:hypothetical protein
MFKLLNSLVFPEDHIRPIRPDRRIDVHPLGLGADEAAAARRDVHIGGRSTTRFQRNDRSGGDPRPDINAAGRGSGAPRDDERPGARRVIEAVEFRRPPLIAGVRAAGRRKRGRIKDPAEDRRIGKDLFARGQADVVAEFRGVGEARDTRYILHMSGGAGGGGRSILVLQCE